MKAAPETPCWVHFAATAHPWVLSAVGSLKSPAAGAVSVREEALAVCWLGAWIKVKELTPFLAQGRVWQVSAHSIRSMILNGIFLIVFNLK